MSRPREAEGGSHSLADKLEIVELLYRYAELIDAGDFDGVGELLSRASFGGTGPQGVFGAENIAELFAATTRRYPDHGNTPRTRHFVLNPIVELSGDTAVSRSTFCVVQDTEAVPIQPIVVGLYSDTFGRDSDVPGGWHFTERKVEIQMLGNVSDHLMVDPTNF
ncbi:MAG: nuclear transport factor 2 family protein [Mycobacterium sp.]